MSTPNTCGFTSISDLLAQASDGAIDLASEVAQCPDVCALAWGSGNPDLSGIGANASYILQAILTFLCGILVCVVYELRATRYLNLSARTQKHISDVHDTFLDINAQFSIPVAIAAVIRFHQNAPFYELAFLRALTTMQFMSLLSISVTAGLFKDEGKDFEFKRGTKRIVIIVLYGILEFGFYIGLIAGLIANQSSFTTISELSSACGAYGHIFPWIKQLPIAHIHLPKISAKDFFNPASKSGWRFGLIITGFIIAGCLALILACCVCYFLLYSGSKIFRGRGRWRFAAIPISLAFAIAMLVELGELERLRNIMKTVAGDDFEDNEWGFGQVIALFLWLPLILQYFYAGIRFSKGTKETTTASDTKAVPSNETTDEKKDSSADNDADGNAEDKADGPTDDKTDDKADGTSATVDEVPSLLSNERTVAEIV